MHATKAPAKRTTERRLGERPRASSGASAAGASRGRGQGRQRAPGSREPPPPPPRPRPVAGATATSAQTTSIATAGVVRVRLECERGVRIRRPGERERDSQVSALRPRAQSPAEHEQPEQREQVERDRRPVPGCQVARLGVRSENALEREVEQVVHRPVGVAVLVVSRESAAIEPVTRGDPVRPDDARVPDVDHARVRHVQRDAEAHQEQDCEREPGDRDQRHEAASARPARAEPDPQHPHEQVREHGVHERHRDRDLPAVEEEVRRTEGEQREQVEVQHAERPPRVHERQQEEHAQRQPHVRCVELAAELPRIAARHLPRDLPARPRLHHRATQVVHDHLRALLATLEEAHLPPERPVEVREGGHGAPRLLRSARSFRSAFATAIARLALSAWNGGGFVSDAGCGSWALAAAGRTSAPSAAIAASAGSRPATRRAGRDARRSTSCCRRS